MMPVFLFTRIHMLWDFITTNLLWSQGIVLLIGILVCAILGYLFYRPLWYGMLIFFLFSFWFFRNPKRQCSELHYDKSVIICPADGKIVDIQFHDVGFGFSQKVSICLSLLDAHVNWIPVSGVISHMVYKPGTYTLACLPKSSELNERHDVYIKNDEGKRVMVRQIAGALARRICWWVHENQRIEAGDTFGMIRFGSRVELFLPEEVVLTVGIGQLVYGGQTVIGRWTSSR